MSVSDLKDCGACRTWTWCQHHGQCLAESLAPEKAFARVDEQTVMPPERATASKNELIRALLTEALFYVPADTAYQRALRDRAVKAIESSGTAV